MLLPACDDKGMKHVVRFNDDRSGDSPIMCDPAEPAQSNRIQVHMLQTLVSGYRASHPRFSEKLISSAGAFIAIAALTLEVTQISQEFSVMIPVLASMGASTFLLFAVPHSPMAQPWPMFGGHIVSAFMGVACASLIPHPVIATASAVALAIFAMHLLHCMHPPSAATAMIAVLGGPEVHAMGYAFCYEVVALNAVTLLLLALFINNVMPGRRYPMFDSHHPHHEKFLAKPVKQVRLTEEDFEWALGKMDGFVDVSKEDLLDIYEFALEHANLKHANQGAPLRQSTKAQSTKA
jgi:CBS domain-containing membrane protein